MSNKAVLTLILIAMFFWAVNGFRHSSLVSTRPAARGIDWRAADVRPYQRTNLDSDPEETEFEEKQSKFKLASANTFAANEIGAGKTIVKAPTIIGKDDVKKKKKKKKKKKDASTLPKFPEVPKQVAAAPKPVGRPAEFNPPPMSSPAPFLPPPGTDEERSFEAWARLLLARPDKPLVDRFIREFQTNLITADVFYEVVEAMYERNESEFKELAVRAAGSVSTMRSFNFLITVLEKESSGSTAANMAQTELHQYELPNVLPVIHSVLVNSGGDKTALSYAVQAIESSTSKFMKPNSPYSRVFLTFISPLQKIIAGYAGESSIAEPARRALTRIQTGQIQTPQPPVVAGN